MVVTAKTWATFGRFGYSVQPLLLKMFGFGEVYQITGNAVLTLQLVLGGARTLLRPIYRPYHVQGLPLCTARLYDIGCILDTCIVLSLITKTHVPARSIII